MTITPEIVRGANVQQDPMRANTAKMVTHTNARATVYVLTRHSDLYNNRMSEVVAGQYYNIHGVMLNSIEISLRHKCNFK